MKPEIGANTGEPMTYPYTMGYLPPEFVKKAQEELSETPERKKQGLQEIRNLISKENGLRNEWFNDDVILSYLRAKKYRTQDALSCMKKTVAFVKKYPHYFEPLDEEVKNRLMREDTIKLLPRRDEHGRAIFHVSLSKWDLSKSSVEEYVKYAIIFIFHALRDPMTQVNGAMLVYDFQNQVLRYMKYFTPYYLYLIYQMFFECFPLRAAAIHALNPTLLTKISTTLALPLLAEKFKKRIFIHSKTSGILDHVQKNIVPTEYGGTLEDDENFKRALLKTACIPDHVIAILKSLKS